VKLFELPVVPVAMFLYVPLAVVPTVPPGVPAGVATPVEEVAADDWYPRFP
jgi:hypothetical protein